MPTAHLGHDAWWQLAGSADPAGVQQWWLQSLDTYLSNEIRGDFAYFACSGHLGSELVYGQCVSKITN